MDTAMTPVSFPLWVYAGLVAMGLTLCGLGYLSAQHIAASPQPLATPQSKTSLSEILKKSNTSVTTSGNTVTMDTSNVVATLQLLQKNHVQLTHCHITANKQNYTMTLEAPH